MSEFTRRNFIGKTAVAIGSFAALQKVVRCRPKQERSWPSQSGAGWPEPGFHLAAAHGLEEPGPKLQVSVFFCEQTHLRRRMVTRGDRAGASSVQDPGRRKHETHCRWIPRAALAHGRRVGHHALRDQRGLRPSTWTAKVSSPT